MQDESVSRRDALKLTTAGAAALTALAGGAVLAATKAEAAPLFDRARLAGKTLSLGFRPGVKADAVHRSLEEIFRLSGCPSCGLLGFDIFFRGIDPDPIVPYLDNFEQIEGVRFADIRPQVGQ